ncbi:MAG: peptidase domain-containing ABC transporter [Bacteroidota bacterium]
MNIEKLIQLINHFLKHSGIAYDPFTLDNFYKRYEPLPIQSIDEFAQKLSEIAEHYRVVFQVHHLSKSSFIDEVPQSELPVIGFVCKDNQWEPAIVRKGKGKNEYILVELSGTEISDTLPNLTNKLIGFGELKQTCLVPNEPQWQKIDDDHLLFFTCFKVPSLLGHDDHPHITPLQRVFRLLKEEKNDISYIYFYAIMMGLVSLALPLGIQAIIGLISGGLFLNSVIVLMFLVIAATIASGWIQVLQLSVVEVLQQRIFAKAAMEFTYRIPRLKIEALGNTYAPELMNRFFDILTIQKSLPKILIDLSTAGVQILFGLILLAFYHPLFIFLGLFITFFIVLVFFATGKKAVETDIQSSKYKYKVAYWIEELARTLPTFKQAGDTPLPINKMDKLVSNYLTYRKSHFKILVKQFKAIIAFKTFITAGLLVLGGILVVERQINLGQFVAAEVIILLVLSSVEKLISTLENVYDVITAADKVGHVTDIDIERNTGIYLEDLDIDNRFSLEARDLSYFYPGSPKKVLSKVNFTVSNHEKVCILGYNGSGKSTLVKIISGMLQQYEGRILVNGHPLKQINLNAFRNIIANNLNDQEIFEGTIEENITLMRAGINLRDIEDAIEKAGLKDFVLGLDKGIYTNLEAGGTFLSKSNKQKLLLARSFVSKPKLLVIDEFFYNAEKQEKENLLKNILSADFKCAVLIISNEKSIMEKCDNIIMLQDGQVMVQGSYDELMSKGLIQNV